MAFWHASSASKKSKWLLAGTAASLAFGTAITAPAQAQERMKLPAGAVTKKCDYTSKSSASFVAWQTEHGWRYKDEAASMAAYLDTANNTPPWPDWFQQGYTILPKGTRFQMAMAPASGIPKPQPDNQPGGWGTFDNINSLRDVREYLAVLPEFKPYVDRINTYEVTENIPVRVGPVGPQVDKKSCTLLPGRWSQLNMLVFYKNRMSYLKLINQKPLPDMVSSPQ